DTFLHGGSGDDALKVTTGSNVLDGGDGSNFLVGGTGGDGGHDTFFVDARTSAPTWSTIVNFHAGDQVTIWGFQAASSTTNWVGQSGIAGFTGATLQAQVNGHDSSVTFAGVSDAEANQFAFSSGTASGQNYLLITRLS
ncbi:MAG TPA: hypothetical protein VE650_19095, partial [Acetobacteraceae bacterium]|nr:hypothetical protein [Acetobacteraceae bacterium]